MKFLAILVVPLVLLITGCATTDRVILDATKRPPTLQVDIYKIGEKPKQPYKEVARLSFLGPREDELKALRYFVAEAKKLGANGVVQEPIEDGGIRGGFNAYGGGFKTTFVFKATAIAYQ